MTTQLPISKYHGCGNDFLLIRKRYTDGIDLEKLITCACDRRSGIGADGFIIVEDSPLRMHFYNADGTRAPMCGNGIRCFARFCIDEGIIDSDCFDVITDAGVKTVNVISREPFLVKIAMGQPDYSPSLLGIPNGTKLWEYPLEVNGTPLTLYSFFMSTVHTVCFVENAMDDRLLPLAEAAHEHPLFPNKTNFNLVQIVDDHTIKMRTWERGAGLTLACGTGACSAALTAYKKGMCIPEVDVILPKGTLHISIDKNENIFMTGPASRVSKGDYYHEC